MRDLAYLRSGRFALDLLAAMIGAVIIVGLNQKFQVPVFLAGVSGVVVSALLAVWIRVGRSR